MPADSQPAQVLRFENVTVSFDGVAALRDVTFEAFEGESRVILGAAGSGKTVLLKTALGLVRPDSGKVLVFGQRHQRPCASRSCSISAAASACCSRKARCSIR